jgi:hypothetical protein
MSINVNFRTTVNVPGLSGGHIDQKDSSSLMGLHGSVGTVSYEHVVYITCYICYMFSLGPSSGSILDWDPSTRVPGHCSPGTWSQEIFLFFIFYFLDFFLEKNEKKNFSLFVPLSLSFSLSLYTQFGFF